MTGQLMLGNEAVARGFYEAGALFASSYPGTPSTEITEAYAKYEDTYAEWAPNEKVAVEAAFGASLAGYRSFACMKHVGLNVAADPLFTMSYTGVNAGLVIVVADDAGMHSSQNEQDSRHYAKASKVPMLEPSDSQEALEMAKLAFELSEEYDTPVLIKMCTRVSHSQSVVVTGEKKIPDRMPYSKDMQKYVMMPANAKKRHPIVEHRLFVLQDYAEGAEINRVEDGTDHTIGIITDSTSYQYVKEACGDTYPVLKLGMVWPMPERKIMEFSLTVDKVIVVEELDGFIEDECNNYGIDVIGRSIFSGIDELSQNQVREGIETVIHWKEASLENRPDEMPDAPKSSDAAQSPADIPNRPPAMCSGCPHRGLFYVLHKLGVTVSGDIGCYTLGALPPLGAMDSTLCMGASVSALHGFVRLDPEMAKHSVAVIGDSTFMHSGMTGLANVAYNGSHATVIILDNSITGMTGHQQNPTTGYNLKGDPATKIDLEQLCRGLGIQRVRVVDPYDLAETEAAVREELAADEPSVIISRRPCVLLKYVKTNPPIACDASRCKNCKMCMGLGCPAISMVDGHAVIDETLCTGCGVCEQLCKFGALRSGV